MIVVLSNSLYGEGTLLSNISIISDGDFTPERFDFENGIIIRQTNQQTNQKNINFDFYFEVHKGDPYIATAGGMQLMNETELNNITTAPLDGYQRGLKIAVGKCYCVKTRNGYYVKFKVIEVLGDKRYNHRIKIKWVCQKNGTNEF